MKHNKILIITYYWPPCGGVAVQRWLKMVKYLASDYDITVYTPSNADYPSIDPDLINEIPSNVTVLENRIFEPYNLFRKLTFKKKGYKLKQEFVSNGPQSLLEKLAVWVRGNFFIPDARKFWISSSIKFISKEFETNNFDLIISNGTPHSTHLIALGLKNRFNVKWIADFRDPWTTVDYFDKLRLSKWAKKMHQSMECSVLNNADLVTTVSDSWAEKFRELGAKKVEVIYNGFDQNDYKRLNVNQINSDKFILSHVGSLNEERNKDSFWAAIRNVIDLNNNLEIRLVGDISSSVYFSIEKYNLKNYVSIIGSVSHKESLGYMASSNLLLLFLGNLNDAGRIPAKVFEYIACRKPILAIASKESDVANIINRGNHGMVSNNNTSEIGSCILSLMNEVKENSKPSQIKEYSRESLSLKLKLLIDELIQ